MIVRGEGRLTLGEIERTIGGRWFADAFNAAGDVIALGAFETKDAARAAVRAWHDGQPIIGKIPPSVQFGGPARGMSS